MRTLALGFASILVIACNPGSGGGGTSAGADGGCASGPPPHVVGPNGVLDILASKACYAAGEQIALTVTLKNTGAQPCKMINLIEGSLSISSMTLNGSPVVPKRASAAFLEGMSNELLRNLVPLNPGAAAPPLTWESDVSPQSHFRYTLETISVGHLGQGDVSRWSLKQPGQYTLTVKYTTPKLSHDTPADLCRFTDTASIGVMVKP